MPSGKDPRDESEYCDWFRAFLAAHDHRWPAILQPYSVWLQEMRVRFISETKPTEYRAVPYAGSVYPGEFHSLVYAADGKHVGGDLAWYDACSDIEPAFTAWLMEQVQKPDCFKLPEGSYLEREL